MLAPAFLSFIMSSFLISSRSRRHVIKVKGLQLYFCVFVYFPGWFSTRCCKLGTRLWTNSRNGNCRTHGSWQNCFHWLNWGKPCIQDCVNSYMNTCRLRAVSFSSYLVRGVHAREKRGRQPERPLPSRTLSNPRGHLCVSNVLLDGPRKKETARSLVHISMWLHVFFLVLASFWKIKVKISAVTVTWRCKAML